MDQHPVPQNITNFQFKLIGDMTLGQFGYLAGGLIIGYLLTLLPWAPLFKLPLAAFIGFLGIAFAFMPIEERPLDRWFVAFFKAVYAPTQFLWKKTPPNLNLLFLPSPTFKTPPKEKITQSQNSKLNEYLKTLPPSSGSPLDLKENDQIKNLNFDAFISSSALQTFTPPPPPVEPETPALPGIRVRKLKNPHLKGEIILPLRTTLVVKDLKDEIVTAPVKAVSGELEDQTKDSLSPEILSRLSKDEENTKKPSIGIASKESSAEIVKLKVQNENLSVELKNLQEEINNLQKFAVQTTEGKLKLKEMLEKYQEAQKQKEFAINELTNIKRKINDGSKQTVSPLAMPQQTTNRVRFVPQNMAKNQGLPVLTQVPNIITGLIANSVGNVLPGVIVTIKDSRDNPVRAMKSNAVGQFKTTTPLASGIYTIELEKEGYDFDIIEVDVKGEVLPPLDIKAK